MESLDQEEDDSDSDSGLSDCDFVDPNDPVHDMALEDMILDSDWKDPDRDCLW